MSTRPVSACAAAGIAAYRVDPARTYRPGRRSRLSCALMASRSSGTCWYSSISTGSADSTNRPGSARTADRVAGSSQSITGRPSRPANWPRSVLLPTVRGPLRTSTGSSANRASATSTRRRSAKPVKTSRMLSCYLHFPGFRADFSRFPPGFPFSASQLPQIHMRRDQSSALLELGSPERYRTWRAAALNLAHRPATARIVPWPGQRHAQARRQTSCSRDDPWSGPLRFVAGPRDPFVAAQAEGMPGRVGEDLPAGSPGRRRRG